MIPLTTLEYELNENPEKTFSRFKWAIEEKEYTLISELTWKGEFDTQKDWVGQFNKQKMTFDLEQPGFFFKQQFDVIVKGKIELKGASTIVKVKAGLPYYTLMFIALLTAAVTLSFIDYFILEEYELNSISTLQIIIYPLIGFLIIRSRLKNAEKKLDKLFN